LIKNLLSEPLSCDDDVVQAGEVLDLFCQWTRARMNKKKTKALGLGNWRHRSQWPLTWLESPSTLSLLGIKFSPPIVETADRVWKDAFGHLHGILRENASRRFTLYQRVNFIKTKALPRTVYIAHILQCNGQMADRILSVVMNYIWMGKVERPQRAVVYRPVNQGGLGMIHVGLFYRSLFLCPIYKNLTGPESPECSLLRFWMSFPLRTILPSVFRRNIQPFAVVKRPPYLQEPLHHIKNLLSSSILVQGRPMVHRNNYRH